MMCGVPGTGTPHLKVVREMERSVSPCFTKLITSLRRVAGAMNSALPFV
jgi:hypothetical protein